MRKIALTVLFVALVGAVMSPTAAAKRLHSNVVSWAPADVQPGMPVEVTLVLYTAGPTPYPKDGTPVAGVNEVEVVIRGEEETHRFATQDIGGGRYRTELIFPKLGGWDLRVRYAPGSYGHGDEVLLGKGAICVGGELCIDEQPEQSRPGQGGGFPWMARAVVVGVAMIVALVALLAVGVLRRGSSSRRRATGSSSRGLA